MPFPLAFPLVPALGPGAAASATLAVGVAVQVGTGGLPFRGSLPGQEAKGRNNQELERLIQDALAGARLPVAFPEPPKPPPLGPNVGQLIGAAAAGLVSQAGRALSQFWGYASGRPDGSFPAQGGIQTVEWEAPDGTNAPMVASVWQVQDISNRNCETNTGGGGGMQPTTTEISLGNVARVRMVNSGVNSRSWSCGGSAFTFDVAAQYLEAFPAIGPPSSVGFWPAQTVNIPADHEGRFVQGAILVGLTRNGQPVALPGSVPIGFVPPEVEPETEPRRPLAPPLAPPATPVVPQVPTGPEVPAIPGQPAPGTPVPQPPGTPAPAPNNPVPYDPGRWSPWDINLPDSPKPTGWPGSAFAPQKVPTPGPLIVPQIPGAQPTTPGGQVVTRRQPGPTTTRPGTEVIGGITIPNRPPAPTLTGIAAEVGRIEQKLAVQLRAPGPGVGELGPLLQMILDLLEATGDQGVYLLGGPCERDSEGQPIPFEDTQGSFEYGGQTSALANIASRIDALAGLLQYHKLLRQPTCLKAPPALGGEWVTVNFEQVT